MNNIGVNWEQLVTIAQLALVPSIVYLARVLGRFSDRIDVLEKDYIRISVQLDARKTRGDESHAETLAAINRVDQKVDKLDARIDRIEGRGLEK